jgi:hypothetical protein
LGCECYQPAGLFGTETQEPKMTNDHLMGMMALFAVAIYLYYLAITPRL